MSFCCLSGGFEGSFTESVISSALFGEVVSVLAHALSIGIAKNACSLPDSHESCQKNELNITMAAQPYFMAIMFFAALFKIYPRIRRSPRYLSGVDAILESYVLAFPLILLAFFLSLYLNTNNLAVFLLGQWVAPGMIAGTARFARGTMPLLRRPSCDGGCMCSSLFRFGSGMTFALFANSNNVNASVNASASDSDSDSELDEKHELDKRHARDEILSITDGVAGDYDDNDCLEFPEGNQYANSPAISPGSSAN